MQLPSFTDYLEYVYFFPACLVGPAYDYYEFHKYIKERNSQPLPSAGFILLKSACVVFFAVVYLWADKTFPFEYLLDEEFLSKGELYKGFIVALVCAYLCRFKYYAVWTAADITLAVSGLSYNGKETNGIRNIRR